MAKSNLRSEIIEETVINAFSNKRDGFVNEYAFYFHMFAMCNIIETEDVELAGVNFIKKWNLYINPKEFQKYSLNQRLGIIKHEMLHIIFNHLVRMENKEKEEWNLATDCAINQMIRSADLPKERVDTKSLSEYLGVDVPTNQSADYYYDLIMKNKKQQNKCGGSSSGGCPQQGDGSGSDESDGLGTLDDHNKWEESESMDGIEELIESSVKDMVSKAQDKNRGLTPQELNEIIEIIFGKSVVNWKSVLRNIVSNRRVNKRYTIQKRNRRFPKRIEIRGTTKEKKFDIVVILDISGSMNDSEIQDGLNEIKAIAKLTKSSIKIIQVDTTVKEVQEFTAKTKTFNRLGCGGTMMYPALQYIKDNKIDMDCGILISDMMIESLDTWEQKGLAPKCKFIFLNTSNHSLKTTTRKNYMFFDL